MNAERAFLEMLREEGRRAAGAFLVAHAGDLGHRSTAELDVLLAEC
jgi:NTE family protein